MLENVMTPNGSGSLVQGQSTVGELRFLASSGDYSLILRRSSQLAKQAKLVVGAQFLARDLSEVASESPVAALMAIECLASESSGC